MQNIIDNKIFIKNNYYCQNKDNVRIIQKRYYYKLLDLLKTEYPNVKLIYF